MHLHLLATPLHPLPLVPILCVADEHNIVALMVSAVFQRQALGLDLPVIGILYPTTGSIISVLVAWRDDTTPVVGISLSIPCTRILGLTRDSPSLAFVLSSPWRATRRATEYSIWNEQNLFAHSLNFCTSRQFRSSLISTGILASTACLPSTPIAYGVWTIAARNSNLRGGSTSRDGPGMYMTGQSGSYRP